PSADFCRAVRPPLDGLSRRGDTRQISRGKFSRLPCTIAGSTLRTLDGYGLRGTSSARPMLAPHIRFLSIDSHVCSTLLSDPASRRATPLRFASASPPSGRPEDFPLQATEHARHTSGSGGASRLRPSHTTGHTGPYHGGSMVKWCRKTPQGCSRSVAVVGTSDPRRRDAGLHPLSSTS